MELIKLFLVATLLTLIPGQILRIPPSSQVGAITITDISVIVLDVAFILYSLAVRKSLKFPNKITFPFVLFAVWSLATIVRAFLIFTPQEVITSSFFLARLMGYFLLSIVTFNLISKNETKRWINLILFIGVLYTIIGFVQFVLVSDLTFLTPLGWDPHQRRIVSTVIDPNFSGYIFVLLFSLAASYFFFASKKTLYLFSALIFSTAAVLTFSRSSYLAFIAAIAVIGIVKSRKLLAGAFVALILIFILVPQVKARVIGALTIDETAQARIESWTNALVVIRDNPAFGVGFNTYRFAQEKYNFFSLDNPLGGHSGGGVDSSLLLVAATTGIIGLSLFIFFLGSLIKVAAKNAVASPLHLAAFASIVALLVHSIFVNSLFFPQIMLLIFPLLGLAAKYDS